MRVCWHGQRDRRGQGGGGRDGAAEGETARPRMRKEEGFNNILGIKNRI